MNAGEAAELYGNPRRSPLMQREEAKALTEKELIPSEAVTVVISEKGWARCAKGQHFLLASDGGYGFVTTFATLVSKNKNGKAVVTIPKGALLLPPCPVSDLGTDLCLAISNEGRMLVFPLQDLPKLSKGKGKGNKIISIPSARAAAREEFISILAAIPVNTPVTLVAGKRKLTLKPDDLAHYSGERGRRGSKLPRGLLRVDEVLVE